MLGLNICIWVVLYFYLCDRILVRGCYQGRLDEVLEMVAESETGAQKSIVAAKCYQNDDAQPKTDDMVTAIEFVGDDDVLFYKGEIHEQTLVEERAQTNRRVSNVFMGIFCTIFAVLYLIFRGEEKRARKAFVSEVLED